MDIPVLGDNVIANVVQRSIQPVVDKDTCHPDVGTGLPDSICDIHQLLPYPAGTEGNTPYPCEHVQLHPADHCHDHQHNHRNGHPDLAEDTGLSNGLRRSIHRQPKQDKSILKFDGSGPFLTETGLD